MQIVAEDAVVCAVLAHGDHGGIARVLTREAGLVAAFVHGARSRRLRPALALGTVVRATLRGREGGLPTMTVEPVRSSLAGFDALGGAALAWVCALVSASLPEGQTVEAVHRALGRLLEALDGGALEALATLARFELLVLTELGFGIDLARCAGTGLAEDLAFVSPRARAAVGRLAGAPYAERLLPLPPWLAGGGPAVSFADALDGLRTTGWFLRADLFERDDARALAARDRLIALVERKQA